MTDPTPDSSAGPAPPTATTTTTPTARRSRSAAIAAVLAGASVVGLTVWLATRPGGVPADASGPDGLRDGLPAEGAPTPIALGPTPAVALWVDVTAPARLWGVVRENVWLQEHAGSPLVQGFLGSWRAFLGTRGEDIRLERAKGVIASFLAESVLADPFRVVLFAEPGARPSPVVVVPAPSTAVRAAIAAFSAATRRGMAFVEKCPDDASAVRVDVARFLVGDHALYGGLAHGRLALGQDATQVAAALCATQGPAAIAQIPVLPQVDVEVSLSAGDVDRGAQVLLAALGIQTASLQLGIDGARLVPRGVSAALEHGARLDTGTVPESVWKLAPDDVPVALVARPRLPKALDVEALAAFWSGKGGDEGSLLARAALILFRPRAIPGSVDEVAVVWSAPEDEAALGAIFAGKNPLLRKVVCGHVVLASTAAMLGSIERTCAQGRASYLQGSPAVAAALTRPLSLGLYVDTARVARQLLLDGWETQHPVPARRPRPPAPAEIEAAAKQLDALPTFFATGSKAAPDARVLAPQGFRS